eukprot:5853704-Pleurochrysis_carterae.AAC.6
MVRTDAIWRERALARELRWETIHACCNCCFEWLARSQRCGPCINRAQIHAVDWFPTLLHVASGDANWQRCGDNRPLGLLLSYLRA